MANIYSEFDGTYWWWVVDDELWAKAEFYNVYGGNPVYAREYKYR